MDNGKELTPLYASAELAFCRQRERLRYTEVSLSSGTAVTARQRPERKIDSRHKRDEQRMLMDVVPGQVLGRYELLMPVARGGMAMVWAARLKGSRGFQKLVAIKTMLPAMSDDPNFERMFLDEASLASEVRHPHVIEILDLGEQDNVLYLVMEWVDGEPLNVLMNQAAKQGGVPLRIAISLVAQACRGLHAAHELRDDNGTLIGLVHRDVTPHNILVTYDGVVKIVDFGVAKATSRIAAETEAGQLKGKIAYMSPEQLLGEPIDRRTDVFAMGILLYMLLTGVHPFKGEDQTSTIQNITSPEPARSIRKHVPGLPPALEAVVAQALAKDPARRFPSANDLLKALIRVMPASTDEEVAEYVRNLLQDRLEKRRRAVRAALEIADEREELGDHRRKLPVDVHQDDVATVVHRTLPPSLHPNLDPELDSAPSFERVLEDSLPGAKDTQTTGVTLVSRLRTPAIVIGALVGMVIATLVALFTFGEPQEAASAAASRSTPEQERGPGESSVSARADVQAGQEDEAPSHVSAVPPEPDGATESLRKAQDEPARRATTSRASGSRGAEQPQPPATSRRPQRSTPQPFVTPVRDPGF